MHRAQFIAALANEHGWRRGAELGVWHGKTMARYLADCPELEMIGVDVWRALPDGMKHYANWDHEDHERQARENTKAFGARVTFLKMTTDEAALQVRDGSLDFVFIDADHRYEAVRDDIANWRPKIRVGGYLMGHDINWEGVERAVRKLPYKHGPDNCWYVRC